jgi:hypothetical protein
VPTKRLHLGQVTVRGGSMWGLALGIGRSPSEYAHDPQVTRPDRRTAMPSQRGQCSSTWSKPPRYLTGWSASMNLPRLRPMAFPSE